MKSQSYPFFLGVWIPTTVWFVSGGYYFSATIGLFAIVFNACMWANGK